MKDTVIDSILDTVAKFPTKEALLFRKDHHFESLSYEGLYAYAQKLATYLAEQGVKEGDRLIVISENRPEWVITDIASMILGTVLVPIHSVLASAQIEMIVSEINPAAVLISTKEMLGKILEIDMLAKSEIPIGYFETDLPGEDVSKLPKGFFSFKEKVFDAKYTRQIEAVKHKPNRMITIIYTSGTTGRFKGVELTNQNIMSNIQGVLTMVEITENDKFLSILPLSHIFERTVGYYIPMVRGGTLSYVEDPAKLTKIAVSEKPTIIIAVPRLFEKVYQAICDRAAANPIKRVVFNIAFRIGKKLSKKTLAYKLADKIVFHQIKEAFGGEIRFFVSGAASLQREIGEFFDILAIPVLEGYGLTETSPIITCNTLEKRKYGSVGFVVPNLEVKLTKNGELLVRGPSVFSRYFKNPEKTKEAFTKDGYFKTGDLVKIDSDGFVTFQVREKEIIALSTGKKVSPAYLEEKLQLIPCISQAFIFGDNKKHIGALIVPDPEKVKGKTKAQLYDLIQKEIDLNMNKLVSSYEQIRAFIIINRAFTVENGLLTPTLKLRRKEISEKYAKEIELLYVA